MCVSEDVSLEKESLCVSVCVQLVLLCMPVYACVCVHVCACVCALSSPLPQLSADHSSILVSPVVSTHRPPDPTQVDLHPALQLGPSALQTH